MMLTSVDDHSYEAFAQFGGAGKPIQHVGSVRGVDPELAWHAAKEAYTRREDCTLLWVVPRGAIVAGVCKDGQDLEILSSGNRAEFRKPAYPSRHRRGRAQRTHERGSAGEG